MRQWLFAKFYDRIMEEAEEKNLRAWRQALLSHLSGDVLEIGCGTGANLDFYPPTLNRLVLAEPNKTMNKKLQTKITSAQLKNIEISHDNAERLSFNDASFDIVVCTLVLCSVKYLDRALAEMYRVLKSQGKLIFIEHIAASNNPKRYQWQRRLNFLWKHIAAGCQLTRHTKEAIKTAGFNIIEITEQSMRGVPPVVRPSIRGVAIKGSV